jgi:pimeloyl-ACP methyl ester carboxylesterase
MTHGWPGSVMEFVKVIDPLVDPVSHGGNASDALELVIPSLPGHGWSGKPTVTGWSVEKIAQAWIELMDRLGHERFVAQGGDWGARYTDLRYFGTPARGGHFAAYEAPDEFVAEVRAGLHALV